MKTLVVGEGVEVFMPGTIVLVVAAIFVVEVEADFDEVVLVVETKL